MYVCVKCRREMICDKNGVGAQFGTAHVYLGDRFKCPVCEDMILATAGKPVFDREHNLAEEYLVMKEPENGSNT